MQTPNTRPASSIQHNPSGYGVGANGNHITATPVRIHRSFQPAMQTATPGAGPGLIGPVGGLTPIAAETSSAMVSGPYYNPGVPPSYANSPLQAQRPPLLQQASVYGGFPQHTQHTQQPQQQQMQAGTTFAQPAATISPAATPAPSHHQLRTQLAASYSTSNLHIASGAGLGGVGGSLPQSQSFVHANGLPPRHQLVPTAPTMNSTGIEEMPSLARLPSGLSSGSYLNAYQSQSLQPNPGLPPLQRQASFNAAPSFRMQPQPGLPPHQMLGAGYNQPGVPQFMGAPTMATNATPQPQFAPLHSLSDLLSTPELEIYSPAFVAEGFGDIETILALGNYQLWVAMLQQVGRRSLALGVPLLSQHEDQIIRHLRAEVDRRKNVTDPIESRKLMQNELARTRKLQREIYTRQQQLQSGGRNGLFGVQDPNHPSNSASKTGQLSMDEITALQAQYGVENGWAIAFAIEQARFGGKKGANHFFSTPDKESLAQSQSFGLTRDASGVSKFPDMASIPEFDTPGAPYDPTLTTSNSFVNGVGMNAMGGANPALASIPDRDLDLSNPAHLQELQERLWRRQQQQLKLRAQAIQGGGQASAALLCQGCNCCDFHWLCCFLLFMILLLCSLGLWGLHHGLAHEAHSSKKGAWTFVMVLYIIGFILSGIFFLLTIFACFTKPGEKPCAACYDIWCGRAQELSCLTCCAVTGGQDCCYCCDGSGASCCDCRSCRESMACRNDCCGQECCCCYCIPGGRCCDPSVPQPPGLCPNCFAPLFTGCACRSCCSCGFGKCCQQALIQMCPRTDCSCCECQCQCVNCGPLGCCDTCYRIICCKFRIQF